MLTTWECGDVVRIFVPGFLSLRMANRLSKNIYALKFATTIKTII
jgi:hypothetical protein